MSQPDRSVKIIEQTDTREFLSNNLDAILSMMNCCFDVNFKTIDDVDMLEDGTLFVIYEKDKIIGIASVSDSYFYKTKDKDVKVYDSWQYLYHDKSKDGKTLRLYKMFQKDKNRYITFKTKIHLGQGVYSICKSKGNENVLTPLLDMIAKHYKAKGEKYIYTIPESTTFLEQLKDAHYGLDSDKKSEKIIKNFRTKYMKSQEKLIKMYEKHGFEIYPGYYDGTIMPRGPEQITPMVMVFPVMRKKI
jgi:hypothetical protein